MNLGTRTQWYRSLAVVYTWKKYAWDDDHKFTIEDVDETLMAAVSLAFIWKGNIILASIPGIAIAEAIVVTGAVASFAIGGVEGVDDYIGFIMEPAKIPERIVFTAETIYEHKIEEPLVKAAKRYVGWVDRRMEDISTITEQLFKFRWMTGPSLPF